MSISPNASQCATLLGQLLVEAGIIAAEMLEDARETAEETALPLDRVLLMTGQIVEGDLRSAVLASEMVHEGALTLSAGVAALTIAYQQCLPLHDSLSRLGEFAASKIRASRLADLLLKAHILQPSEITKFSQDAAKREQGLGRYLVNIGRISTTLLACSIDALTLVRDELITFSQAVFAIQLVSAQELSLEEALVRVVGPMSLKKQLKLGELLTAAGLLPQDEALNAAELGLESGKKIGRVLQEYGIIPPLVSEAAVVLHHMLRAGKLTETRALELLKQVHTHQVSLSTVLDELEALNNQVVSLLLAAKVCAQTDIDKAVSAFPSLDVSRALIASGRIDLKIFRATVRLVSMERTAQLGHQEAREILTIVVRNGQTLEEAIGSRRKLVEIKITPMPQAIVSAIAV